MDLCNINEIKLLLTQHGFHFSKSLGQNFLIESWVPADIAEASGAHKTCGVLEIGPGIGPLTHQLALRAGKVAAVELDRSLLPVLAETMAEHNNVEIISGDIMKLDIAKLAAQHMPGLSPMVCANLPYNITTPVLSKLIEAHCFTAITVMIQREVALRICAAPDTADYGSFSIFCQYYTQPELLFDVPPTCFLPAPKVTSAVIRMTPRDTPLAGITDEALFFQIVRASFAQRRKTLLNGLSAVFGSALSKDQLRQMIVGCGFREDIRGERLGIPEFTLLTQKLQEALA